MCVGVPYQILDCDFGYANARSRNHIAQIDMRLVGDQPPGTFVLTFLGAAREVITADDAHKIADALEAVERVMAGDVSNFDHLFADLIHREPTLPDHLLVQSATGSINEPIL